jgi:hypothetical protein
MSAPDPSMVNVPLDCLPVPFAPTAPISSWFHGLGRLSTVTSIW